MNRVVICLLLVVCCMNEAFSTPLGKLTKKDEDEGVTGALENEVNICEKRKFLMEFAKKQKALTDSDYHKLHECKSVAKTCTKEPGTMTITYIENTDKQYLIIFQLLNLAKQGCWGYALQLTDNLSSKTVYFNFKNQNSNFTHYVFIRLGFVYNFTVTPLPAGKPLTIVTKSPTMCELDIINIIYEKIKKKEIFQSCTEPDYASRRLAAEKICNSYENNPVMRYKYATKKLIEEDCKFKLL